MATDVGLTLGLYPSILGDSWEDLAAPVRRLHEGAEVHAEGSFYVARGGTGLVRCLAHLLRLPAPGAAVPLHLRIHADEAGETWERCFADRWLVTRQRRRRGALVERLGMFELRFSLRVVDGALEYETPSVAWCLGRLRVPVPRWLRPHIRASERAGAADHQVEASIDVHLPVLGRLIAYEGRLEVRA